MAHRPGALMVGDSYAGSGPHLTRTHHRLPARLRVRAPAGLNTCPRLESDNTTTLSHALRVRRSKTDQPEEAAMVQVIRLAREIVRKAWAALMPTTAPAQRRRPQLAGRRGYGDGEIKSPEGADKRNLLDRS